MASTPGWASEQRRYSGRTLRGLLLSTGQRRTHTTAGRSRRCPIVPDVRWHASPGEYEHVDPVSHLVLLQIFAAWAGGMRRNIVPAVMTAHAVVMTAILFRFLMGISLILW
jgi:hypothetical protein